MILLIEILNEIDRELLLIVQAVVGFSPLDELMLFLTNEKTWLVVSLFYLFFVVLSKSKILAQHFLMVGVTTGASDFLSFRFLKPFFGRFRPCHQYEWVTLLESSCGGMYGFPSNHAFNSAVVAGVTIGFVKSTLGKCVCLLCALMVGISRPYVGVHFPFDVLFGWFLGALVSFLALSVYWKLTE